MSKLRMVLAAVAVAVALVFVGPMLWGTASASANGPHMTPGATPNMGRHDHNHDRDDFPRFPRFNGFRNNFNNCCNFPQPFPVYATYVPVYAAPLPAYAYAAPTYGFQNYGPGWNYGMSAVQVQQTCNQYNQALAGGQTVYNQYVAGVCISVAVYGNQVTITVGP